MKEATLATKATRGGGPPYKGLDRVRFTVGATPLLWAKGRLSAPRCSDFGR